MLAAIGASAATVAGAGCGESADARSREPDARSPDTDGAPSKGDAGARDSGLDSGPTSKRDSAVMDSAVSREGESSLNEAGVKTTRVPTIPPGCLSYPVALHTSAEPAVVASSCSAEAAAEYQADYACF
ncbi:MAG: hypothetical protein RLZZ450_6850, partial [Pseudomonadota bacterium]